MEHLNVMLNRLSRCTGRIATQDDRQQSLNKKQEHVHKIQSKACTHDRKITESDDRKFNQCCIPIANHYSRNQIVRDRNRRLEILCWHRFSPRRESDRKRISKEISKSRSAEEVRREKKVARLSAIKSFFIHNVIYLKFFPCSSFSGISENK